MRPRALVSDGGRRGVKNCPNLRDAMYERSLNYVARFWELLDPIPLFWKAYKLQALCRGVTQTKTPFLPPQQCYIIHEEPINKMKTIRF